MIVLRPTVCELLAVPFSDPAAAVRWLAWQRPEFTPTGLATSLLCLTERMPEAELPAAFAQPGPGVAVQVVELVPAGV